MQIKWACWVGSPTDTLGVVYYMKLMLQLSGAEAAESNDREFSSDIPKEFDKITKKTSCYSPTDYAFAINAKPVSCVIDRVVNPRR